MITFSCYGAHLHGDERGSVDRLHNVPGGRLVPEDSERFSTESQRMLELPYTLEQHSQDVVLDALREVCAHRGWSMLAAHVRTNHVHVVVEAEVQPEKVMNDFKAYASRLLNRREGEGHKRKRWSRHGAPAGCGMIRTFEMRSDM